MGTTVKDIARKAKVSVATVSLALRDSPEISEKTKKRIRKIAEKLNYIPNFHAKILSEQKTDYFGFILPNITDSFFAEIFEASYKTLNKYNFNFLLFLSLANPEREIEGIKYLVSRGARGITIFSVFSNPQNHPQFLDYIATLKQLDIPVVFIDRKISKFKSSFIGVDNEKGGKLIAQHLISLGHRNFLFLYGEDCQPVNERFKGFSSYIKSIKNTSVIKFKYTDNNAFLSGYNGMKEFIKSGKKVTAVFCASDGIALGAIRALKEANINVPQDISVAGFDNLPFSHLIVPSLTTIKYSRYKLGEISAKWLVESTKNKQLKHRTILVQPELIVRESTTYAKNS